MIDVTLATLVAAGDWSLVRRLPDDQHPRCWERLRLVAVVAVPLEASVELTAVLPDGTLAPLRPAVVGRDGTDRLEPLADAHRCQCTEPVVVAPDVLILDGSSWCWHCAGRMA